MLVLRCLILFLSHAVGATAQTLFAQFDHRGGSNLTTGRNQTYDYVPSIIWDEKLGLYRMWWCGGAGGDPPANFTGGDHVLYAESSSLDGPWHSHHTNKPYSYDVHLYPSKINKTFDSACACDPSVIEWNGTYYLYYGGLDTKIKPYATRIGLALSDNNGYPPWTRYYANNTGYNQLRSLINPAWGVNATGKGLTLPNYGCGQPSVFYFKSWFYMVFTDLTGIAALNQNVVYVLRSSNPYFQSSAHNASQLQELGSNGWFDVVNVNGNITARTGEGTKMQHTQYYFAKGSSTDWVVVPTPSVNYVMFGEDGPMPNATQLQWWDIEYLNGTYDDGHHNPMGFNYVRGIWTEGCGIVHVPDGTAVMKRNESSGATFVYADVMRSVSDGTSRTPWSWWLSHDGVTISVV